MSSCSHSRQCREPSIGDGDKTAVLVEENDAVIDLQKRSKRIALDAGHGGVDFGTESPTSPAILEKSLNLVTTYLVQSFLTQMGYNVILTRSSDIFLPLKRRAEVANGGLCDLFVSIHFNSAPSKEAHGIEAFFYQNDGGNMRSSASKKLAQAVLQRVIAYTEARSRGVKHGNLAVIRETTMPAVLIEGGFLTNEGEAAKLRDSGYVRRLAWGIAQGIQDYFNAL